MVNYHMMIFHHQLWDHIIWWNIIMIILLKINVTFNHMMTFQHLMIFHHDMIWWLVLKGPAGQWGSRQEGVQKYLGNHNCFRWWVIKSYLENVAFSGFSCSLSLFDKYFNVNNMMKMHHMMDFHPIKCLELSLFHWLSILNRYLHNGSY